MSSLVLRRSGPQDLSHGLREIFDVVRAQTGDVHPAVISHVDMVLLAQALYLWRRDTEEREHPLLPGNEAEVPIRRGPGELLHHLVTQTGNALAHGAQLFQPLFPESGISQDLIDDGRPVIRWHRVDAARNAHEMTQDCIARGGRLADDVQA